MDFTARLQSESMKVRSTAAVFLGNEGADGVRHLPALLTACSRVDLDRTILCWDEAMLLCSVAMSTGAILNAVGFDHSDSLHSDALDWLLALSRAQHPEPVGGAIYGLERVGIPPIEVRDRLCELVVAERSARDYPVVTTRAVAFRVLSRIDRTTAQDYVASAACREYLACIDHWVEQLSPDRKAACREDLRRESQWLDRHGC
ncbi:hypothetical protein MalM25_08740 [Planctomycetes bacterium MalM25]|nr:hypothetical protein MalM25_08740 [Planctomycetes bacterium MalM25]